MVSSWYGSGVVVAEGVPDDVVAFSGVVGVGVVVTVRLRTTGTTVCVGTRAVPLRTVVEIVAEAVVSEKESETETLLEDDDWGGGVF